MHYTESKENHYSGNSQKSSQEESSSEESGAEEEGSKEGAGEESSQKSYGQEVVGIAVNTARRRFRRARKIICPLLQLSRPGYQAEVVVMN